ncbi:MAG TPA: cysteine desulfurase family protein [Patescibacteria group bacterium]|nr:cysteine desulfurase family protein [Patescibacteria group bacterium]
MPKIYLDYAATAPVRPQIKSKILPYFSEKFGNPSSIHKFGREARKAVDENRKTIADFLNCQADEVIFTSGGTEADNLAVRGLVTNSKFIPHIITTQIEHHAVLNCYRELEKAKRAKVTYLRVNPQGQVNLESIKRVIQKNTLLVSIMYANNETGSLQPIREIGKMLEKMNKSRAKNGHRIYFHTDAVQAAGYENCNTKWLHVDLLTLSGHKLGATKGIGALFVKKNTPIKAQSLGGEHEFGLRAGTENVPAIVGFGKAIKMANNSLETKKIKKLRDYLQKKIIDLIPDVQLNGDIKKRVPHILNLNFKYVEGESIILNLDFKGIAASTGSACTSGSLEPSHVIMAMYQDPFRAHGSIRFSLGWKTTQQEIDYVIKVLPKIIKKLRQISPFGPNKKVNAH